MVNLTDAAGSTVRTYDYDAFGNERNPVETDANPFRYCGEYWDSETGTYYLRARYYDPLLGRFLTEDPALDGLNWYSYCCNNPILYIDPTGLVVEILYHEIPDEIYNHVDIAINGTVYSFAAYEKQWVLGFVGEGTILVVNKDAYIASRNEAGRTVTVYELNYTKEQEDTLLSVINGYLQDAEKTDTKRTDRGQIYKISLPDDLGLYVAIPFYGIGENCATFVYTCLFDAGLAEMPKLSFPMFHKIQLDVSYAKYITTSSIADILGIEPQYRNGLVVAKTVFEGTIK